MTQKVIEQILDDIDLLHNDIITEACHHFHTFIQHVLNQYMLLQRNIRGSGNAKDKAAVEAKLRKVLFF